MGRVKVGATEGAVVVMDAATGAVRALVGGRDYAEGDYNRATLARRQPGSAFKPFVWLAALEHGRRPDDLVLDAPLRIGKWSPVDFEPGWRGEVTLEQALRAEPEYRRGAAGDANRRPGRRLPPSLTGSGYRKSCPICRRWLWAPARSGCWK